MELADFLPRISIPSCNYFGVLQPDRWTALIMDSSEIDMWYQRCTSFSLEALQILLQHPIKSSCSHHPTDLMTNVTSSKPTACSREMCNANFIKISRVPLVPLIKGFAINPQSAKTASTWYLPSLIYSSKSARTACDATIGI